MKEVELLLWFKNLQETKPGVYGGIIGFSIGFSLIGILMLSMYLFDVFQQKRNKKREGALSLIGETVTYKKGSSLFVGQVVSIDFDLEDGELEVSVYIDVDGLDHYVKANYEEFNKTLFLKEGD